MVPPGRVPVPDDPGGPGAAGGLPQGRGQDHPGDVGQARLAVRRPFRGFGDRLVAGGEHPGGDPVGGSDEVFAAPVEREWIASQTEVRLQGYDPLTMSVESQPPATAPSPPDRRASLGLLALVVGAWVIRALQAFRLNVNWDEFHYLSYVYEYQRGVLEYAWATFHVHFFGWLSQLGGNEIDSIIAARLLISLLGAVSGMYIYLIARRFMSIEGALFAVLSYLCFSFVLEHGSSFRPDPLCAVLFVAAAHHLLPPARSMVTAALAGVAMAVSLMITIKGAMHLVVLGAILTIVLVTSRCRSRDLVRGSVFGLSFVVALVSLYIGHRSTLAVSTHSAATQSSLSSILATVFPGIWFPGRAYLLASLQENPLTWLTLILGGVICLKQLFSAGSGGRADALLILALASPILSLAFYRNAFPYFYVFILPLAVLLSGLIYCKLLEYARNRQSKVTTWLAVVLALAVFSTALPRRRAQWRNQLLVQRQLINAVHEMFPEPVEYIDRCSMISSFPQVGFFMSSWGMRLYRAGETRSLTATVTEDQPVLLVANVPMLDLRLPEELAQRFMYPLLVEDARTLRDNFIHHWGLIFVAGKHLRVSAGGDPTAFPILVAGPYTLEAGLPATIDGQRVVPGQIVDLAVGEHSLSGEANGIVTLRWGRDLYRPREPPVQFPIFVGF